MKSIIRNLFLVIALSAVIIMIIGIYLYDYIPTGATVAKANTYEVKESTTKILSEITENSQSLVNSNTTTSEDTSTPNVILQTYSVTKNDLAIYQSSGDYEKGKSNPFADAASSPSSSTTGNNSSNSNNNSNNTTSEPGTTSNTNSSTDLKPNTSDGTLFNSTTSK